VCFEKRKGAKFKSAGANNFLNLRRDSTFEFSDWHRFLPSKAVEKEIVQRAWNGRPCAVNLIPLSTTCETAWQRRLFDFSNKIAKGVRKKRETSVKNRNRRLSGFSFVSFYFPVTACLAYSTLGKMETRSDRSKRWQVNGLMRLSSLLSQPHLNVNASRCKGQMIDTRKSSSDRRSQCFALWSECQSEEIQRSAGKRQE
jgi:hypothetical protein